MGDQAPTEDHRIHRAPTPAPRPVYSVSHEPQVLSRTPSAGQPELTRVSSFQQQLHARPPTPMHNSIISPAPLMAEPMSRVPSSGGGRYVHIPEYAASTISEFEVEQRDRIAKINAEYNSHTSSSSSGSSPNDADRRWTPSIPTPIPARDNFTRVASSQPLHPNLHYQTPQETEFNAPPLVFHHVHPTSSTPVNIPTSFSHGPYPRRDDSSPPSVERLPSQLQQAPSNGHGRHPLPTIPSESWSRDATFDSEQAMRGTGQYRTSPKNTTATPAPTSQLPQDLNGGSIPSSRSAHATYTTSAPETTEYRSDRRQDRPIQPEPVDTVRRRKSSMVGSHPDAALSRSHSEAREYIPVTPLRENNTSSYGGRERERDREGERERERERGRRDRSYSESPPRGPQVQGAPSRDTFNPASSAADLRRDTRTPVPSREPDEYRPTRRDSYAPETARPSKDTRTKSQSPEQTYIAGPLSASPTQMRMSPTDVNPSPNRVSPPAHEAGERIRTRSISFSQSARPITPAPSAVHYPPLQQPQIVYNGGPDPRQQGSDRRQRPGEISSSFVSEPSHTDQRKDTRGSNPQATYYPQAPAPPPYESTSQRQHVSMPPPPAQLPSRSIDRSTSTLQSTSPTHTRGVSTQERPRSSFVEPVYTQPHTEPLRRHSDDDEPYSNSTPFPPRSTTPHDKPGSNSTKVMLTPTSVINSAHASYSSGPAHTEPQPQRRYSDGDQAQPAGHRTQTLSGKTSAPLLRSVRWTENLICPSPILAGQRRKGWFNRRGYVAGILSPDGVLCFLTSFYLYLVINCGRTTGSTSLLRLVRSTLLILTVIQNPVMDG